MRVLARFPWIPGASLALVQWIWVARVFDFASDAQENIDLLWQSLGSGILESDPLGSLLVLHIQPPLLNALFGMDLMLTPDSHAVLMFLNLGAMVGSLALMADSLTRIGVPWKLAAVSGIAYAILPGTVAYSFWVYNVTITSFFAIAVIWGVAIMNKRVALGLIASSSAALGLLLTRSTFAFPILVVWLVVIGVIAWRRGGRRSLLALVGIMIVAGGVQLHYFVNYGLITMNSWGGQYLINAARTSGVLEVSNETRAEINRDPCTSAVWAAFEEERLNIWDPGGLLAIPECGTRRIPSGNGHPAWDQQFRPENGELNLNWRYGLAASSVWTEIAVDVVRGNPLQYVRMALWPPAGISEAGVVRYLGDSRDYPWIAEAARLLPLPSIAAVYWSVFASLAWILVILGWLGSLVSSFWRRNTSLTYWLASGFLTFHVSASTLLEYAEAMRFRAEVEPVLFFVSSASLWYFWLWIRKGRITSAKVDTSADT